MFLALAAFVTAVISGVVGMAGGVTLLAAMTLVMPLHVIVPIHGAVQFCSNLSRSFFLFKDIHKGFVLAFYCGAPIGGLAGYFLLSRIQRPEWAMGLIAFLLIYVALKPKKLPGIYLEQRGFMFLGVVASLLGCLIGATGPLLAPFFLRKDLSKESIVATKAACQIMVHLVKFPVFIGLSFSYGDHMATIVVMIFAVVLGTWGGTKILRGISTDSFIVLLKGVMLLIAIRLIYKLYF